MTQKEVSVLVKAIDALTAPFRTMGTSVRGLGQEAGDLLRNKLFQGIGFAGIIGGLKSSWEASDRFDASLRGLQGTAKITGVPLDILKDIAKDGAERFHLSAVQSNNFATELAKLAGKAGDVGQASAGLEAFLDIGAAKGLSAEETLTAVKQSILGIDEGTDKLFNKNPSVLYQEFADKIGTTAGKLTDQQKAQALLNAALEDGGKVRGEYLLWLDTAAGKTAKAANEAEGAMAKFGASTATLRTAGLEALVAISDVALDVVRSFQKVGVDIALLWDDVKASLTRNKEAKDRVAAIRKEMYDEIDGITKDGEKKLTKEQVQALVDRETAEAAAATKRKEAAKKSLEEREKAEKEYAKNLQDVTEELAVALHRIQTGMSEQDAKEWVKRQKAMGESLGVQVKNLKDAYTQIDAANLQLKAGFDDIHPTVKQTETAIIAFKDLGALPATTAVDLLAKKLQITTEEAEKLIPAMDGAGESIEGAFFDSADAVIGLGRELGALDETADRVLTSFMGIAESLGKGNVAGVIGGLTGVLGSIFADDAKRMAAIQRNAAATEKLASVNGELLALNTPGRVFSGAQKFFETNAGSMGQFNGPMGRKNLVAALAKSGLTLSEFVEAGKDLGYDVLNSGGGVSTLGLQGFRQGIGEVEFSSFGNTFADQMRRIGIGKDIGAIGAGDELGQVIAAIGQGGPNALTGALSGLDLSTAGGSGEAVANLRQLFNNIGTLGAGDFGELTQGQFLESIQSLIALLTDDVADAGGVLVAGGIGGITTRDLPVAMDSLAQTGTEQLGVLESIDSKLAVLIGVTQVKGGDVNILAGAGASIERIDQGLADLYRLNQMGTGSAVRS